MLTYPDREKFAQIRAQWELAQPLSNSPHMMAGRKERATGHVSSTTDEPNAASSKFRRKLSHGFSFISNTRTQRRTTPGRQAQLTGDLKHDNTVERVETVEGSGGPDGALSPDATGPFTSPPQPLEPNSDMERSQSNNHTTTPNPLARSLTMSHIPRPVKEECNSPAMQMTSSSTSVPPPSSLGASSPPVRGLPTKIPTPSPPQADTRRRASPRQYVRQYSTQQEKHIAAGAAFAGAASQSPSKASVRSYTTPNLHQGYRSSQPSFMVPGKSTMKSRPMGSPTGKHTMFSMRMSPRTYMSKQR